MTSENSPLHCWDRRTGPHRPCCRSMTAWTGMRRHRNTSLTRSIQTTSSTEAIALPATAVARGALLAAGRAGDGALIYFDFLPRWSTIVFGTDGAANFDLIRPEETLKAGRIYRSPEAASLAIPAGQENVSFYLRKEAADRPRKAIVSLGAPLRRQAAVSLSVEPKTAAGRADIIGSSAFEAGFYRGLGRRSDRCPELGRLHKRSGCSGVHSQTPCAALWHEGMGRHRSVRWIAEHAGGRHRPTQSGPDNTPTKAVAATVRQILHLE